MPANWYDYENKVALGTPLQGEEVEVFDNVFMKGNIWERCKMLFVGRYICVYSSDSFKEKSTRIQFLDFRPLDWNGENN